VDKKSIQERRWKNMSTLLKLLIPILMQIVESLLTPENLKLYGDKLFDLIEDFVANSETEWDDKTILPIIKLFRIGLDIPDND
jgi:Na+-transporting methylmalonyl-CoA/oxaloacetate decarboxylase beta subunit